MSQIEQRPGGLFDSLRGLCDGALALLQNRLELFAVEAQEEKARLLRTLVLTAGVLFLAGVATVMVTISIVFVTGEAARLPVLLALTLVYVVAAAGAYVALRKHLRSAPPPFHGTLSEFKKDREWLSSRK
jgi:uncharacterized membrane protein YqjE